MRPEQWNPPIELSNQEQKIVKRIKRAKLFTFLRSIRHLLFDEDFQAELAKMYAEAEKGHPPVPPAQLALTTILQAYTSPVKVKLINAESHTRQGLRRQRNQKVGCIITEVAN